jgi:GxxExxY protein
MDADEPIRNSHDPGPIGVDSCSSASMTTDEYESPDSLSERVLAAIFEVSNTLGAGFLEKVYERALLRELVLRGISAVTQASFAVVYKGQSVGEYFADILVEGTLVIELKCVDRLTNEHTAQCLNYLRASGRSVCLLVNFQRPKVEWKRIVRGYQDQPSTRIAAWQKKNEPTMNDDGRR